LLRNWFYDSPKEFDGTMGIIRHFQAICFSSEICFYDYFSFYAFLIPYWHKIWHKEKNFLTELLHKLILKMHHCFIYLIWKTSVYVKYSGEYLSVLNIHFFIIYLALTWNNLFIVLRDFGLHCFNFWEFICKFRLFWLTML
jgi:hypothetical protein